MASSSHANVGFERWDDRGYLLPAGASVWTSGLLSNKEKNGTPGQLAKRPRSRLSRMGQVVLTIPRIYWMTAIA